MKISLNWLNRYIDLSSYKLDEICSTLTSLGLEVEGSEEVVSLDPKVVVGKIESAQQHPDADKLQVCSVNIGSNEPLEIVCGAANARKDLLVAVAQIGSVLPEDFKIKAGKIRGVKSFGMLCSGSELGLSGDNDGILELPEDFEIGKPLVDIYQLRDSVIEIGLTPNRSDCLGYIGVARDLSAKLGLELKLPNVEKISVNPQLKTEEKISVSIADEQDCGRFTAVSLDKVQSIPSPLWLQTSLQNSGVRPINIIVDATNYVMLEAGQPIHAYDLRDLEGGQINVRRAAQDETLTTLDGVKHTLRTSDIVIADQHKAIGLAGIMGGENTEVKEDTTSIIIEVAHFNPSLVRKTSKLTALHTDASHRFERGIDFSNIAWVSKRVSQLIYDLTVEVAGPEAAPSIASTTIDQFTDDISPKKVAVRLNRVRQLSGIRSLTLEEASKYLQSLGFNVLDKTPEGRMLVEVPSWRLDIERETDLIEEIVRLHGYDKIPLSMPQMEIAPLYENPLIQFSDNCKTNMAHLGLSETISFPFISPADLEQFNISESHPCSQTVRLENPLVEEQSLLRTSLIFSLVKAVSENRRHGIKGSKIFELGRNFYRLSKDSTELGTCWQQLSNNGGHITGRARQDNRPTERTVISAILDQPFTSINWQSPEKDASFFSMKEIAHCLLRSFDIRDVSYKKVDEGQIPWVHPHNAACVYWKDQYLGYFGELHPRTSKSFQFDINKPPLVLELDVELLLAAYDGSKEYSSTIPKFPAVTRDLAFVTPKGVTYEDFKDAFSRFNRKKHLQSFRIFDVYEGRNLNSDMKSMAFKLEFQSEKRTLTDQEVEKEVTALINWMKEQLSVELR